MANLTKKRRGKGKKMFVKCAPRAAKGRGSILSGLGTPEGPPKRGGTKYKGLIKTQGHLLSALAHGGNHAKLKKKPPRKNWPGTQLVVCTRRKQVWSTQKDGGAGR